MTLFVCKFIRQAKLFCIYCINEDVGLWKPLFGLLFSGSIPEKQKSLYCIAIQFSFGRGKLYKMLALFVYLFHIHFNLVTVYYGQISKKHRIFRSLLEGGAYSFLSVKDAVLTSGRRLLEEIRYRIRSGDI